MDLGNDNLDFSKITNTKPNIENVTPHKIAVIAFIREFVLLRIEEKSLGECVFTPKHRKDFCLLSLKLIQCPDMEFKELEGLLTNGNYHLFGVHLQNFCHCLQTIYVTGVSALMDCVTSTIDKLMIEPSETSQCMITRTSVLGFYLRRIMLQLDRLTFVQLGSLFKSYCVYYQKGRPGLMIRSLSKEKLNNVEPKTLFTTTSPTMADESKQNDLSIKYVMFDKDHIFEEGQWSRKQAELFTAQQANLLQINEKKALPAKELQKSILQIINDIPEYSDIHFLSFLNCIRMRELSGAQDSLYNCFDRTMFHMTGSSSATTDRNKHFRYAALNRAAMHTQFQHNEIAMEGVREALSMAQGAGDPACLSHAAAWAARAGGAAGRALLPRTPRAPRAAAAAALAAHVLSQHRAVNGLKPAEVFTIVTKGDSINYLHSMTDLTLSSLSNTAALWSLYGKTEMASVYCQLLLNLNTKSSVGGGGGGAFHWTESCSAAAAGLAAAGAWRGDCPLAATLSARHRSPLLEAVAHRASATAALYAGKWEEADQSIRQLASYDRWESQLLKAEMYFLKGVPTDSLDSLHDILDYCKTEDDSLHFMSLKLRAMILKSQVQQSFGGRHSMNNSNIMLLNEALSTAKQYHLHYLAATAEMHIANVQLHMGCVKNSLDLVRKVLPTIMAHGGAYDMARGLLLYVKCRVACAPPAGNVRAQVISSCCTILDSVKSNFLKIGAQSRLLETWYFQAQLYNEIGNVGARNQCAWMYRQLETQNPVEQSNAMLMLY